MTDQQKREARIATALLILGVSGAGKTSLLETFARYLWETYQKVLLLYSWDGGAIPTGIQKCIHQGLIRFWRCRTRSAPGLALETIQLATKGYWPRRINPRTGETAPAVDLVPPIQAIYDCRCANGHPLKTVSVATLIIPTYCTACATMVQVGEMHIREQVSRTKGFEAVGGVAFDGLTSMSAVVLEEMDRMRGLGQIGGEKSSFGGTVISGTVRYGGNNRADVGFAQTRAQQWVGNALSIPGLMESPVFTGLSTEGTDKGGLTIVGLDLPGQAALTAAPQWFGNICEADGELDEAGDKHYVLRLKPFTDKEGRRHLLKTSASPMGVPDKLVDPPEKVKRPFEQFNLGVLLRLLDEDLEKALAEQLTGAPGLPTTDEVEYGEAAAPQPVAPTPPATPAVAQAPTTATQAPAVAPVRPVARRPVARPVAAPPTAAPAAAAPTAPVAVAAPVALVAPAAPVAAAVHAPAAVPPPPGMKPPAKVPGA